MKDVQIVTGDNAVWVSSPTYCIGRFGRQGIDIHRDISEQQEKGECLLCVPGPTGPKEWGRFVEGMKEHYGVDVPESAKPAWVTGCDHKGGE